MSCRNPVQPSATGFHVAGHINGKIWSASGNTPSAAIQAGRKAQRELTEEIFGAGYSSLDIECCDDCGEQNHTDNLNDGLCATCEEHHEQ